MSRTDELQFLISQFKQEQKLNSIANERFKAFVREVEFQNDVFDSLFEYINKRDALKRFLRELNTKIQKDPKDYFLARTRDILESTLASYSKLGVEFYKYYHQNLEKEVDLDQEIWKLKKEVLDLSK